MLRVKDRQLFEQSLRSPQPTAQLSEAIRRLLRDKRSRSEILEELEEFRSILREEKRDSDDDVVLEVMDFLVGWASPHARIDDEKAGHAVASPNVTRNNCVRLRSVFPATSGGVWINRDQAARFRDLFLPPVTVHEPTTVILNLTGIIPTPAVLQDLILPLGFRLRAGAQGPVRLVVQTHDRGVSDFISYLAKQHNFPIYVSHFGDPLSEARPEGQLTSSQQTTLNVLNNLGGNVSASELAQAVGIEPTAAGNRLTDLADRGYIFKDARCRRHRFQDPRFAEPEVVTANQR